MIGVKEDAAKMQRSKHQYYYLGDLERKLRKKINTAKKNNDKQREDELWEKLREIRNRRKCTDFYRFVINPQVDK